MEGLRDTLHNSSLLDLIDSGGFLITGSGETPLSLGLIVSGDLDSSEVLDVEATRAWIELSCLSEFFSG
ncbi:5228_t:CDS:2 [Racocetra fulgida]|uniref:5228_t:CDS:1 n=1 Tax=Racocetra fulgida TaxID=60492 RepID=A0A9N8W9V3_9GLOM|nr:5228_t:CDS:2 [Racocetra fulgida]